MSARRWTKRILLGLLAFLVVAVAVVLVVIHTGFGRELIRKQVEARFNEMFIGGGSVGKIEGSPFTELVISDLVINGPNGKPAISAKKVKLGVGILPLVSKKAILSSLILEDVDVLLDRNQDGELQITHLMKPAPSSGWSVKLPTLEIHRAHVAYDDGKAWNNFDNLEIYGGASMMFNQPLEVNLSVHGAWRERVVGLNLETVLKVDHNEITVPSLIAKAGAVVVAGTGLRVILPQQPTELTAPMTTSPTPPAPIVSGTLIVNAPMIGVAQLVPGMKMPADVSFAANIGAFAPWTRLSLIGQVGKTPIRAMVDADLRMQTAKGILATGMLDLTALTSGKVVGTGATVVMFQAEAPLEAGTLPKASGVATVWGEVADAPETRASIAFDIGGYNARTVVGVNGRSVKAMIEGEITKMGDKLELKHSTIVASTTDPASASGGKAPVHGALRVNLAASGMLAPHPNLSLAGRVDGKKLRMKDMSVASITLDVNARQLPSQPIGHAELTMDEIVRGDMQLGKLQVNASNRADGKILVSARSHPKQNPWLFDVDALVTPPGRGDVVAIDIQHHHIRAGAGGNWTGNQGHIEIGPRLVSVRDFKSTGANGLIALAGELDRLNGDFKAKVDANNVTLDNINAEYRGTVTAHVDVVRQRGRIAGDVDLQGTGMAKGASLHTLDITAKISAAADKLVVDASAKSANLGGASIKLDVDAPKDITDVQAWKRLDRRVIRTGQLAFQGVDLAKLAELAGQPGQVTAGRLDGDLQFSADATGGMIQIRDVMTPALRGSGVINADLRLSQTDANELQPQLTGTVDHLGRFEVIAKLGLPDHLFDPVAWKALGPDALHGATARVEDVNIDPAMAERFGFVTQLRGQLSAAAEVTAGLASAQVAVDLKDLRGSPIAQPVNVHFAAAADDKGANTTLAIRSGKITLLDVAGKVPVTLADLRAHPETVKTAPLDITATIPQAPAKQLLGVFGRSEITGGTLAGTIQVKGTVGAPLAVAKITGTKLAVPPGPNNRPVKMIDSIVVNGTWDGTYAKVNINGVEQAGSLSVIAEANPKELGKATATVKAKAFDLEPILAFAPGPAGGAAGRLDADFKVNSLDPATMRVAGQLHISRARLPVAPQVGTLHRAQLDIVVGDREMKVNVTGRLGGGDVKLVSTFQLEGAMPMSGDVAVTLRKVSPIGTVEPDVTADINAKLQHSGDQWIADVFIKNGKIDIPSGRGEKLDPVGAPKDMVFAGPDGRVETKDKGEKGPPHHPSLVAHVTLYSTTIVSAEVRTLIKGNVTITADADAVGVVGNISADRGDIDLFGRRYSVEQAAVHFDGSTDPLLDLRITHDFSDVTTITTVRGRLSKPELIMSSDPGIYTQGQLLGFLLGGEPGGDPSQGSARDKAASAGTSFVANQLGGYVKKALPIDIDVLRYEAASSSSSAAVLVGTWVSNSLFVAFRQHVSSRVDENRSEGEVEYWLSRRVSVDGTIGDRGYNGVDLLWRKRY